MEMEMEQEIPAPVENIGPEENEGDPEIITAANAKVIIEATSCYLRFSDFKNLRGVSRAWNMAILENQRFRNQSSGAIKMKWYNQARGMNMEETIKWKILTLKHFAVHRHSQLFRAYWTNASEFLIKLELEKCSFECDGFGFILNSCVNLASLKMKKVKLRDLFVCHRNPPLTNRFLVDLSFDSMYEIGECFMNHLIECTGRLESISVVNCFNATATILDEAVMSDMVEDFIDDLVKLFIKNKSTLKKMTFKNNLHQDLLLQRLNTESCDPSKEFPLPHDLTITLSQDSLTEARDFFEHYCKDLKSLKLEVLKSVANEVVIGSLQLVNPKLTKLRVSVLGGISSFPDLDLREVLSRFVELKKLNIQDRKPVSPIQQRLIKNRHRIFPFRMHRGLGVFAALTILSVNELNSRIDIRFLENIPTTLTKLTLDGIINYQKNFEAPELRLRFAGIFNQLTKLELKGPWLCPLGEFLRIVAKEAKVLETLVMTRCSLQDTDLTGLCREAAANMRQSMSFVFPIFTNMPARDRNTFDDLVAQAPSDWNRKRNMKTPAYGQGQRYSLSDLKNLKHVDLSYNFGLTDVAIYDAINLPKLEKFAINSCNKVTDLGMEMLVYNCPALEVLNVKNCRNLSMYGLDRVIRGCRNLRTIYTTKVIRNANIEGFIYKPSANYLDIVKICINTEFEDPNLDEADELEE